MRVSASIGNFIAALRRMWGAVFMLTFVIALVVFGRGNRVGAAVLLLVALGVAYLGVGNRVWIWLKYPPDPKMLELVKAVLRRWDPIGVLPDIEDSPAFAEYDSYAPKLVSMLIRGRSVEQIAAHLDHIRRDRMGLPANSARDLQVAKDLVESWSHQLGSRNVAPAMSGAETGRPLIVLRSLAALVALLVFIAGASRLPIASELPLAGVTGWAYVFFAGVTFWLLLRSAPRRITPLFSARAGPYVGPLSAALPVVALASVFTLDEISLLDVAVGIFSPILALIVFSALRASMRMRESAEASPLRQRHAGIDVSVETENAETPIVAEVLTAVSDPRGFFLWGLSLCHRDSTACLRFIDPYGHTTFTQHQLPVLLAELEAARSTITQRQLELSRESYLKHAASWPQQAFDEARTYAESLSLVDIQQQFDKVIDIVRYAVDRGPHVHVNFNGD